MHATASLWQTLCYPHIIDDAFIDTVLGHVTESIKALELKGIKRRKAQRLIEATACQAIAEMWTAAFRGQYKPTRTWPQATAIILADPPRVVIELWIGHDYHSADIPDPIEVFLDGE